MISREKEYISRFMQYSAQIHNTFIEFNTVSQYYYALEIIKQFRRLCTMIGKDPRFTKMNKFLSLVREKDREYIEYLRSLKRKFEDDPKIKTAEKPPEGRFKSLIEKFYFKVDQLSPLDSELEENKEEFIINKKISDKEKQRELLIKGKSWIQDWLKLVLSPEEEKMISEYRKTMTSQQKKLISCQITPKEDEKIFKKYAEYMKYEFDVMEKKGWVNSIRNYSKNYRNYLEKVGNLRTETEYIKFRSIVRKTLLDYEDWLGKVDRKYEAQPNLALDEISIINPEIHEKIILYKYIRRAYIRYQENRKIIKTLAK